MQHNSGPKQGAPFDSPEENASGQSPETAAGRASDKGHALDAGILRVLSGYPEIRFCVLFGSASRGALTSRSDVDIAVAGAGPLTFEEKAEIAQSLAAALGREVDLIDLSKASGLILQQALCTGRMVKNDDHDLYAALLKRLWYNQADMMPLVRRILEGRSRKWIQ